MEFDSLFTAIQGIMRSHQNTTVIKFEKVNKDNDIVSENIVGSLETLIKELALKDLQKRRINLLFFVNTDFPNILSLEDDKNFWHLLGCMPKMSPYLYFQIVTNLKFHVFVGEVICLCPEYLVIDLLSTFSDNLKLINPDNAVPFFYSLFKALFQKIVSLQNCDKPAVIIQKFVKLYKDFISFNIKELPWENEYIQFGYITQMILILLADCIVIMKTKQEMGNFEIYDFNVDYDYCKWGSCSSKINWINHCLSLLVAVCADIVQSVSVDIYLSWCEEDIKGSVDKTLQTSVREAAWVCREEIRSISLLNDEISSLKVLETSLSSIAIQPITEDDEIHKANAETIVINLLNPKRTQVKWLKGLICIPGFFQSSTYMKVIEDNAHLFNLELAKVLLDTLLDFLSNSQCPKDFYEVAKDSFFSCIKKQPLDLQMDLLAYYLDKKITIKMLQRENFQEALTSALNKISATKENKNEILRDIVILCFENNEILMRTLLNECLSSDLKADMLLDLLSHITPLANMQCCNTSLNLTLGTTVHLMDTVVTSLEKKKDNFVQLVRKLCALGFIDGNVFFPMHVIPRFEESINEANTQHIIFYLDVLALYANQNTLPSNAAALLLFVAKFMDSIRPSISNLNLEKLTATAKAIDLVTEFTKKIVDAKVEEDEEIKWLQNMGGELKPMTRIHLKSLWTKWGLEVPSFPNWAKEGLGLNDQLITASENERRNVVTTIVKVLPLMTLSEWYLLGSFDTLKKPLILPTVEAVIDSLLVSVQVPFLLKNVHVINNMLVNFSQFVWEKVIPKLKTFSEVEQKRLKDRLVHLQEAMPVELQKTRVPQMQLIIQTIGSEQPVINQEVI